MKIYYIVEPELFEMKNDGGKPCNEDHMYDKDKCMDEAFEKYIVERYGCTTPFGQNKNNICTNKTIATKGKPDYT